MGGGDGGRLMWGGPEWVGFVSPAISTKLEQVCVCARATPVNYPRTGVGLLRAACDDLGMLGGEKKTFETRAGYTERYKFKCGMPPPPPGVRQ